MLDDAVYFCGLAIRLVVDHHSSYPISTTPSEDGYRTPVSHVSRVFSCTLCEHDGSCITTKTHRMMLFFLLKIDLFALLDVDTGIR